MSVAKDTLGGLGSCRVSAMPVNPKAVARPIRLLILGVLCEIDRGSIFQRSKLNIAYIGDPFINDTNIDDLSILSGTLHRLV